MWDGRAAGDGLEELDAVGVEAHEEVVRFQRFVSRDAAIAGGDERLARVAAELGYSDQAHLTRDCVALSGLTPSALVASRRGLATETRAS